MKVQVFPAELCRKARCFVTFSYKTPGFYCFQSTSHPKNIHSWKYFCMKYRIINKRKSNENHDLVVNDVYKKQICTTLLNIHPQHYLLNEQSNSLIKPLCDRAPRGTPGSYNDKRSVRGRLVSKIVMMHDIHHIFIVINSLFRWFYLFIK